MSNKCRVYQTWVVVAAMPMLGARVGGWVLEQGWGGLLAYLVTSILGPLLIGIVLKRHAFLAALVFNESVAVSIMIRNTLESLRLGSTTRQILEHDFNFFIFMFVFSGCSCLAAEIPKFIRGLVQDAHSHEGKSKETGTL